MTFFIREHNNIFREIGPNPSDVWGHPGVWTHDILSQSTIRRLLGQRDVPKKMNSPQNNVIHLPNKIYASWL